jgi:polyribonucleotide nucleotidyltransferase
MSAGVPISNPVAGIAMGLILEKSEYAVISDILGDEDALGDMDFKVATTEGGITALQMDIKVPGITIEIMKKAIAQAKDGCMFILQKMNDTLSTPKSDVGSSAPKILTIKINKEKIKDVIGPGGKIIKDICEKSQAKIDIEDNGELSIFAPTGEAMDIAKSMVNDIVAEPEVGEFYTGKVVKLMEFGAFVRFFGSNDGLVHISEIFDKRINKVEDYLKVDDVVKVKFIALDKRGKFKLSMKNIDQNDALTSRDKWKNILAD